MNPAAMRFMVGPSVTLPFRKGLGARKSEPRWSQHVPQSAPNSPDHHDGTVSPQVIARAFARARCPRVQARRLGLRDERAEAEQHAPDGHFVTWKKRKKSTVATMLIAPTTPKSSRRLSSTRAARLHGTAQARVRARPSIRSATVNATSRYGSADEDDVVAAGALGSACARLRLSARAARFNAAVRRARATRTAFARAALRAAACARAALRAAACARAALRAAACRSAAVGLVTTGASATGCGATGGGWGAGGGGGGGGGGGFDFGGGSGFGIEVASGVVPADALSAKKPRSSRAAAATALLGPVPRPRATSP